MRTSSRLPALWSFRRLIGSQGSSGASSRGFLGPLGSLGFLAGRLAPGLWLALWIGLGVGLGAGLLPGCTPGRGGVDENTLPPDLSVLPPPPPPCQAGRLRCSADKDATEMCDGMTWKRAKACDLAGGESCIEGVCKKACELVTRGNVGCSFYPVNLWSTSLVGNLGIVVTNTSDRLTAKVTLEDASGVISTADIAPAMGNPMGGVTIFRLDHNKNKLGQTEQAKKAFHLTSSTPVAVYLFHPIDAATVFSGSATLLLPEHVMAKNYFVMSYTYNAELITSPPQGQGFVSVVGLQDNTYVEVTTPVATKSGPGVPALQAKETLKRFINRFEVLELMQINSHEDISGATVKASAPVAVYGGAGGGSIPASAIGGNHLGVQMFPLETWGKRYLAAKVKQRNASDKDYYRIVASVDDTHITLTGGPNLPRTIPILQKSQIFEFSTDSDFAVEADQPILVFQYMPAWGNLSGRYSPADFPTGVSPSCPFAGGPDDVKCLGDANITPLVPVEQYRNDYIFYVPQTYTYDYIHVTAPLDAKLMLDGAPVPMTSALRPIGTTAFGRAIVPLKMPGNHRITADKPFGLIGYGYSYATSYSYAGGLNLERINPIE